MYNPLMPIVIQGLSLIKGERPVLDGLELTLRHPGISVIMGPNGAGKSLLLRCLHGLIEPDQGSISLGSLTLASSRPQQAMVFQHPVLLRRTVLQNLKFAAPDATESALNEALASVNLSTRSHSPARMLSGGEQQRLALARALLTQPKLLLLDEATASLDPASVYLIESLVRKTREMGTKVILISHDQGQARRLADEVIFVDRGRIVEQTPAQDFFNAPTSRQAQAYLAGELII